jgi:hypothetical protein
MPMVRAQGNDQRSKSQGNRRIKNKLKKVSK